MNYSQLLESIEFWREIESTSSVVVCFKQVKFGGDTKYFGNGKGQMRDSGFGNMNKCEINFHKQHRPWRVTEYAVKILQDF